IDMAINAAFRIMAQMLTDVSSGMWLAISKAMTRSLICGLALAMLAVSAAPVKAQTQVPPPATPPPAPPTTPAQPPAAPPKGNSSLRPHDMPSHWIASGFVGADFGGLADGSSFDFGGQIGYLFHGVV